MHQILELYNSINHFGNLNGMAYQIITPGEVQYTMTIREEHLSGPGVAHGGIIAGFMDAVLGVAALSASVEDGNVVSTVEFKINFMVPVRLDEKITGLGKVLHKGQRLITATGDIYNSENQLVARAQGTFNAYPAEKIRERLGKKYKKD